MNELLQLGMAIAALQRIARKRAGFVHTEDSRDECNCPKCIAKDTLEQMSDLAGEEFQQQVDLCKHR